MHDQAYIEIHNLSVAYPESPVLSGVDFACARGEFVSVVGASGSGKSTLLNTLAGFVPYSGSMKIPGRVGYVFQRYALFPWMTVQGNIEAGMMGLPSQARKQKLEALLAAVGLPHLADRYPAQLSGGESQRVAVARTLASDPEIILADEPFGALDYHTRERMQEWLLSVLATYTATVLFVTHAVDEALYMSDRVLVLRRGKISLDFRVPFPRLRDSSVRYTEVFLAARNAILAHMS